MANYAIQQRFREAYQTFAILDKMPECAILLSSSSMSSPPFADSRVPGFNFHVYA
jgi:hypothetical protein